MIFELVAMFFLGAIFACCLVILAAIKIFFKDE